MLASDAGRHSPSAIVASGSEVVDTKRLNGRGTWQRGCGVSLFDLVDTWGYCGRGKHRAAGIGSAPNTARASTGEKL
jgi:hypothetical protein